MAKKKKGYRRKGRSRKGRASAPKTVKGVFKQQPLLVKGGLVFTGLEILTGTRVEGDPVVQLQAKQWSNAAKTIKANAMDPKSYYPVIIGFLGHKGAKLLGIKGM